MEWVLFKFMGDHEDVVIGSIMKKLLNRGLHINGTMFQIRSRYNGFVENTMLLKLLKQVPGNKLYLSSRINVKINIDSGGYFYGKTKKTLTGTQSVHQQLHQVLPSRGCRRCVGHAQGSAVGYPAGEAGSRNG